MLAFIKSILQYTVDFLLPPRCLLCYERSLDPTSVCANCWKDLNFISDPLCMTCGIPFDYQMGESFSCVTCLDFPPRFRKMRSAVIYNDASRQLIMNFKHGDMLQLVPLLSKWMFLAGQNIIHPNHLIIPVPLHKKRLLKRQYNQAALLANHIAKSAGIPKENEALVRIRYTESQGKKNHKERVKNIQSSIEVHPDFRTQLAGKHILLIDDVYTTGATIDECCKALHMAGVESIDVLAFARAVKGRS